VSTTPWAPASLIGGALAPIRFTSKHAHEYSQEASAVHICGERFQTLAGPAQETGFSIQPHPKFPTR
jgi:hypothetical protein